MPDPVKAVRLTVEHEVSIFVEQSAIQAMLATGACDVKTRCDALIRMSIYERA